MLHKFGLIVKAFFLLLVFLFPAVEKSFHAIEHEEDVHCEAIDVQHLHNKHHNCNIADFTTDDFVVYYSKPASVPQKIIFAPVTVYISLSIVKFPDRNYLKAPPVIA